MSKLKAIDVFLACRIHYTWHNKPKTIIMLKFVLSISTSFLAGKSCAKSWGLTNCSRKQTTRSQQFHLKATSPSLTRWDQCEENHVMVCFTNHNHNCTRQEPEVDQPMAIPESCQRSHCKPCFPGSPLHKSQPACPKQQLMPNKHAWE